MTCMRTIERTRRFKCGYKGECRGRHHADLDERREGLESLPNSISTAPSRNMLR